VADSQGLPRSQAASRSTPGARHALLSARVVVPLAIGGLILLLPVPHGLTPDAWHYFGLFVTVIAAIITEPAPPAVLGLGGVVVGAMAGLVHEDPADSARWALSGFGNATVWLIFAGYMLTLGYAQTGLGRRVALHLVRALGHKTLGLGYAIALADLALAPFTASAGARSAGTIYPVVRNIPDLYGSRPGDGTARKIGSYLLYTALVTSFVTSSMFVTALAPNTLALSIMRQTAGVTVSWLDWCVGFLPVGVTLLAVVPALIYVIYPPEVRTAPEAPIWAAGELESMGAMSRRESILLALVALALSLWIGASEHIEPAVTAMFVVVLMLGLGVITWDDVTGHSVAWSVLVWFATLVTLAGGLAETGFVGWLAGAIAPSISGLPLWAAVVAVVGSFFFLHYFFASITAHTASLLPVFLGIAVAIPGLSARRWALLLAYSLGLMGVLTTYASGQSVIYYGSGFIPRRDFWTLGLVLGTFFLTMYLAIVNPWLGWLGI
jgi:L-tartrate/succinate antiporter